MQQKKFLIGLLFVIIIVFFITNYLEILPKSSGSISECPEETPHEYAYIFSWSQIDEIPIGMQIYSPYTFNDEGYHNGYCRSGTNNGENINHVYCDSNQKISSRLGSIYKRNNKVSESGEIIKDKNIWKMNFVLDKNSCTLESNNEDSEIPSNLYKCKIIEIKCREI